MDNQFLTKQLDLQRETKQALAKAYQEARSQITSERKSKRPSPIADIVGVPTYGLVQLDRTTVSDMNVGQLQVILNDICNQTEKTNEDLKRLLVDRDDLYMKQDSLLVDIEDLTLRYQEFSQQFANLQRHDANGGHSTTSMNMHKTGLVGRLKTLGTWKSELYTLTKKP